MRRLALTSFANNYADTFIDTINGSRDFSTPVLSQNAEVDILLGGADPFTNSAVDIVEVLYGPLGGYRPQSQSVDIL